MIWLFSCRTRSSALHTIVLVLPRRVIGVRAGQDGSAVIGIGPLHPLGLAEHPGSRACPVLLTSLLPSKCVGMEVLS